MLLAIPAIAGPAPAVPPPFVPVPEATITEATVTESREVAVREPIYNLADGPFEGRKILVVDDDFRNIFAMTALLERGQALVASAESGPEAIAMLQSVSDIDLVLVDIMMPEMDGYATMRAIRMQEQFASLPIIAVTGKVVSGERERCVAAGANDYVTKPVDVDELLAAIGPWLPPAAQVAA
jgi:CheY-like chemotaxis protein